MHSFLVKKEIISLNLLVQYRIFIRTTSHNRIDVILSGRQGHAPSRTQRRLAVVREARASASALIIARTSASALIIIIYKCCEKVCFGHSHDRIKTLPSNQSTKRSVCHIYTPFGTIIGRPAQKINYIKNKKDGT